MRLLVFAAVLYSANALKYLISTDPGADDAEALVYWITYARKDILAFLPAQGNGYVNLSITNTYRTLQLMSKFKATKIPVFAGAEFGFLKRPGPSTWFGADAFGDIPDVKPKFPKKMMKKIRRRSPAAQAIVRYARKFPGQVVICLQASLTDLAMAYMLEPRLPKLLNKTVIIGGNMHAAGNAGPTVEFNMYADPLAAKIIVDHFNPMVIPYETCQAKPISWDWYDNTWMGQNTKITKFLSKAELPAVTKLKSWYAPYTWADQIAPGLILSPGLITKTAKQPGTLEVCGKDTTGQMVIDFRPGQPGPANVELVMDFDMEKLQENYVAAFGPNPPKKPPHA